ncbi:uroporphyrin-III C-methyltransferase [Gluconacetobacter diazotrophicus PA1 5]|uniref:Siroheme synthase n=2 Tax=Gluconacetobacter diazotrophicus TaxID=33996 RepID=CYSG_GLUDA|nr:siroheme synthase CysG [Gluconacetobacter diazotrophicus]A9H259.1 RecName: Full=Siroheme synthase; Includes: RecName: Full=Uroporphyrinogen-III C-methyltransferase; Short=Urogen III methylase; AltName: Full=SUMT; AltName: Full=Uroporphyrinogen III methylase; Short=UROM; Includes: RecName: Full=Precorrin-2 dehydrogenase; Includes: RecName: Full=Sirohydrochlorin ferrochelatase [Gluconacetobacter diazotrophicus PA1 5]ACI51990.1 uroporphyrin-III C-methyltransferase [Gluconacetobacter diazotrophicu
MSDATDPGWFPLALRLRGARVVVVGGGGIALNKVRLLLAHAARIDILAPRLEDTLAAWQAEGRITHIAGEATPDRVRALLPGSRLVYAATDDRAVNRAVAAQADALNIPVCAVDDPEPSSFITPAQIHRGPVRIAISTGGAAPVLARRLRERIEAVMPAGLDALARFLQAERAHVVAACPDIGRRRRVWEDFLDGPGGEAAQRGEHAAARQVLDHLLAGAQTGGEVWLVGAGPGDPDLLTLRALHLMQNADSVLYDQLLPPALMDRVRRDAERVFVGKQRDRHTMPQDDINAELIRRARAGERVLRLKGGDPFIFGRGGEEIEALMAAGIPFQVVPGITAASGCAAYAGIPLTHRDCAQSCLFVTGHARRDGTLDLPWDSMARPGQTIAIYMGVTALPDLCTMLVRHGLPPDWPAAVVERGTRPDQRVLTGTLADLPALARAHAVGSPALVLVGQVVRHRVVTPPPLSGT